jgi:hypothetical protein
MEWFYNLNGFATNRSQMCPRPALIDRHNTPGAERGALHSPESNLLALALPF